MLWLILFLSELRLGGTSSVFRDSLCLSYDDIPCKCEQVKKRKYAHACMHTLLIC